MKPKVVILCGGRGTRMEEETEFRPKPLVEIGGRPILWHIMKTYAYYGFDDFILCLGYKGRMIKEYFLNYEMMNSDFTLTLGSNNIKIYNRSDEKNWKITFADTGEAAQTGARIKRIEKYINEELFMLTYGDGLSDINIRKLLEFHKSHGKIGTISGVHPSSRFGELVVSGNEVVKFGEKPQVKEGFVNGGFFVFHRKFFNYLREDDDCFLEKEPLENLAKDGQLEAYLHTGFWQCMDTRRERDILNNLWNSGKAPWKVWK
ncbi:MAG TPA: glucose-1-phosphate cytidylyltransferase [Candidatus Ratteibacteria bacterium]|nr:glucose-1-phosphate cytidylyltransferase [bacterium]HRS07035.1 glucose-1-phosphate cytidylyltransferase [Candidatus Ratteibacteria bacterium]HRV05107.1 glucose-1-phosphate cytidylyltransferase [Candidatus Ratteibacteria bacterium]